MDKKLLTETLTSMGVSVVEGCFKKSDLKRACSLQEALFEAQAKLDLELSRGKCEAGIKDLAKKMALPGLLALLSVGCGAEPEAIEKQSESLVEQQSDITCDVENKMQEENMISTWTFEAEGGDKLVLQFNVSTFPIEDAPSQARLKMNILETPETQELEEFQESFDEAMKTSTWKKLEKDFSCDIVKKEYSGTDFWE